MKLNRIAILLLALMIFANYTWADERDKASAAVANILFDYDGAEEFATYIINDDGFVDITFASNMPDRLYSQILNRLQNNPDIKGVMAGKGGPACAVEF